MAIARAPDQLAPPARGGSSSASVDPVFAQLPLAGFLLDDSFRVVSVNAEFERALGLSRTDVVGRNAAIFHRRDELPRLVQTLGRLRSGELDQSEEDWILRVGEGPAHEARVRLRPIPVDGSRRIVGVLLTIRSRAPGEDASVEPSVQPGPQAQADPPERFFEFAPVALVFRDEQLRIRGVNRAFTALSGFDAEALVGRVDALVPEGDEPARQGVEAQWRSAQRSPGTIDRARVRLRTRDARILVTDQATTLIEDASGAPVLLTAVASVTQQHALEEALKRMVQQQGALLRAMSSGVMLVVRDRVIRCNAGMERLLGLPADRIVGREAGQVLPANPSWQAMREESGAALVAQSTWATEIELSREGQATVVCAVHLRSVDASRPDAGLVVTLHDITDCRDLAQRRIDEAIRQRDTLVREVHHRIRNNLEGVAGLLAQTAGRGPSEVAERIEGVVGQIRAIAQVHGLKAREQGDPSFARIARAVFENLAHGRGQPIELSDETFAAVEHWSIPEQEAVPLALVINELGTNAIRHREAQGSGITAEMRVRGDALALLLRNPGKLPDGFALERLAASPSGLGLLRALLPRRGARLSVTQEGDCVLAELEISAPVATAPD